MPVSEQIIEVLDHLGQQLGIAIDWSSQNVLPYLQDLFSRYVSYEITRRWIWIGVLALGMVALIVVVIRAKILEQVNETRIFHRIGLGKPEFTPVEANAVEAGSESKPINEDGSFEFPFELRPEGGEMSKFKKGDRVVVVSPPLTTIKEGARGTVLHDKDIWDEYAVVLDEAFEDGHNLGGACEPGHVYWFWPEQLEPADIAPSIDENAFDALLFG